MWLDIFRNSYLNDENMNETISAIDTITLRIPLDIWAPAPMSQGVPRTHVESLYVRVTTSGGVVGWGESFGTAHPMVIAAFDNWIKRLAVGQSVSDEELILHTGSNEHRGGSFSAKTFSTPSCSSSAFRSGNYHICGDNAGYAFSPPLLLGIYLALLKLRIRQEEKGRALDESFFPGNRDL